MSERGKRVLKAGWLSYTRVIIVGLSLVGGGKLKWKSKVFREVSS